MRERNILRDLRRLRLPGPAAALSRREWLRLLAAGLVGIPCCGWLSALADEVAGNRLRRRSCILLWMGGGPSQLDTFDLKPGQATGGPFQDAATAVPGLQFSEHLPQLALQAKHLAIIRSMTSKEGDHGRAAEYLHSGYATRGDTRYPTLGSLVSKELGDDDAALPTFVSIAPSHAFSRAAHSAGFLGPKYSPLVVGARTEDSGPGGRSLLTVEDLESPAGLGSAIVDRRLGLLNELNQDFLKEHRAGPALSHEMAYRRAARLMRSSAASAFRLEEEPAALRKAYGRNRFGQGCLLARRLVERGVPFVEVALGGSPEDAVGWDTHANNFEAVRRLSSVLDPAFATLVSDLATRGLLDSTLIVWMGEFGRTPTINQAGGRDHYPQVWSAVLAGGGIAGGQAYGRTSKDGRAVVDRPVTVPDLLATICRALGIDDGKQNESNEGRPIRLVDNTGRPLMDLLP